MGLSVCVLASGSSGNSIFIASETTAVLIDAGISARAITRRLAEIGAEPASVRAICLSHEHDDHRRALPQFHKRHATPVYANRGTIEALDRDPTYRHLPWKAFSTGSPFTIGDLEISPFAVPHDAYEPVGFVIRHGDVQAGIATDVGIPTALLRERLRPCRVVVVEANHDEGLLEESPRPWRLKQRIRGRQGHLSNEHAADVLADIAGPHLDQIFLAHLSQECNRADLAVRAVRERLTRAGHPDIRIDVAAPDHPTPVWRG